MNIYMDADGEIWMVRDAIWFPLTEEGLPGGYDSTDFYTEYEASSFGPMTKLVEESNG